MLNFDSIRLQGQEARRRGTNSFSGRTEWAEVPDGSSLLAARGAPCDVALLCLPFFVRAIRKATPLPYNAGQGGALSPTPRRLPSFALGCQKLIFSANCPCLFPPAEVIWPKLGLLRLVWIPPKRWRLKALNHSKRASTLIVSPM